MSATSSRRTRWFFAGFALVSLVLAGVVSYAADSDPDGLDTVTRQGCTEAGEELSGSCPAQHAEDHALAGTPLADYTVGGDDAFTGVAGVLGVLATLVVAGALFWLLRGRSRDRQ
ncbi:PDGLE domain-containing protein [Prauserella oleivorans]|uniref:PDGLE domain-containing protein n=1 Tax=Prauserella oleivorans TaxID=1478153 RepID=A0ABW5WER3_9PSEU